MTDLREYRRQAVLHNLWVAPLALLVRLPLFIIGAPLFGIGRAILEIADKVPGFWRMKP